MLKSVGLFFGLILLLLVLPFLLPASSRPAAPDPGLAPWNVEVLPQGGARVFGITLGQTSLRDAARGLGSEPVVALVLSAGDTGAVEAYIESVSLGALSGKMILSIDTSLTQREQMLERGLKAEVMAGGTRRVSLNDADRAWVDAAPVSGITYIPAAQLDESIILQRFGPSPTRVGAGEHAEHFLYPLLGVDILLDRKGKEVLQYVSPHDFARLRAPLIEGAGASR